YTKTLFEEEEEILQAVVEEIGETEKSHVPTADRVFRVFSGGNVPPMFSSASEDDHDEELEEIDFSEISKLLDVPSRPNSTTNIDMAVVEEKFTGFFIDTTPTPVISDPTMVTDDTPTPLATIPPVPIIGQPIEKTKAPDQGIMQVNDISSINTEIGATSTRGGPSAPDPNTDDISTPVAIDPPRVLSDIGRLPSPKQELDFYIDTEPARINSPHLSGAPDIDIEEDEEVIVYVAPHPRSGRLTPAPSDHTTDVTSLPSTSILTGTSHPPAPSSPGLREPQASKPSTSTYKSNLPPPSTPIPPAPSFESISFSFFNSPAPNKQPRHAPVFTTRAKSKAQLKQRQREARAIRKRVERQAVFGSFGAIMSEAQLRGSNPKRDPRWEERRQDDSDVDWGDEDGEGGGVQEATGLAEGMDLDPDLVMDIDAMKTFAAGMSQKGDRFITMDDIADEERMRAEDEDTRDVGSSGDDEEDENTADDEVDAVVNAEENMMLAEFGDIADFSDDDDDGSDEDDSDDEGHSPRTGFQARLERLRNHTRGKRPRDTRHVSFDEGSDDGDDDDAFMSNLTWAEQDEEFIAHIEMLVDDNDSILTGRDRKERNKLFRAVRDGTFADIDGFIPARKNKDKYKDLPSELQEQWQKDREKKAELRRARELARLEAAADPLSTKKGGKKGRKAMLAAAKLDPTITVLPNRVIDMVTLVQQIRRFIANVGGPLTMSLPPTNKTTRKSIHEMALAFNLKSQSKGKGDSRYTTLSKTTRSGYGINEQKITKLVRRNGAWGGEFTGSSGGRDRGQGRPIVPKHRDGDEVGKAAPKIGQSNIGFKMLASMGWSEGDRIGVTGGLDAPLTAVIKNTKLGLGANK
ncbi:hypothetical protein BDZ94DRAFT_1278370, partial [Collybia nuda]